MFKSTRAKEKRHPFKCLFRVFWNGSLKILLKTFLGKTRILYDFYMLLPEALIGISRDYFEVIYKEANGYFKCLTCHRVEHILVSPKAGMKRKGQSKMKRNDFKKVKCSKKTNSNETASQENVKVSNTEVEFLKSRKSNNNGRIKRPTFKLEKEVEASNTDNHMLTDKHITLAQNLLKKQFPHIHGLISTTLGSTGGFKVMPNKHTGCVNYKH